MSGYWIAVSGEAKRGDFIWARLPAGMMPKPAPKGRPNKAQAHGLGQEVEPRSLRKCSWRVGRPYRTSNCTG
jgi:hypothetical protein